MPIIPLMKHQYIIISMLAVFITITVPVYAEMTVQVFDVGQGDAILVSSADHHLLFDAGPARANVVSKVQSYGVTNLDYFITSHPDTDHIGGAVAIINTIPIEIYADSGATHTTLAYRKMMEALIDKNTPHIELTAGKSFILGDVRIDVLAAGGPGGDKNAGSIVLKLTDGDVTMILPGDKGSFDNWPAQILVVPDHGAAGSNIEAVYPEVMIISVGAENRYNLPAQVTLNKIENMDVELYRTDLQGQITVISDGSSYTVLAGVTPEMLKEPQADETTITETETPTPTPTPTQVQIQEPTQVRTQAQVATSTPTRTPTRTPTPTPKPTPKIIPGKCTCDQGDLYDCCDFLSQGVAQACYNHCLIETGRDVHNLNPAGGRACGSQAVAVLCGWY